MAKLRYSLVAAVTAAGLALTACSSEESSSTADSAASDSTSTVTIEDNFGTQEVALPIERVAATDNRSFQILADWGIDLVAAPNTLVPSTVTEYKDNPDIVDLGSHNEPDLEALTAAEPDLVVNGQRFSQYYEDISTLNPDAAIVELEPRDGEPLDDELKRQVTELGILFEKEAEAEAIIEDFDAAVARAQAAYDPEQTVMAVNVSGGEIGYIAPSVGRTFGPIFDMLDLTPALEVDGASDDHQGDDISVEAIASANPDWMLVLDRDAGISSLREADEFQPAAGVLEGADALDNVTAVVDGQIVYAPEDTYLNESILTYTEILNEMADAFEAAQQ
ncbi:siderophore ABC transporter substrate-binding protein [Corynebacterium alimapuense]|uniref:Iron ABC transporter substrate-binding protein n=1 Tax=Corynebacterium alimapuense TaxID=1576874 RepID=A0A3M8K6G6_9CORY|nr:ABC transporter substrate-binding protein [Corynebacterium alimapuense]RNE48710.1 iron ABC transporter substrate-binding protein [Corynebacterium alimapuense]